jgi:hypothetical protein
MSYWKIEDGLFIGDSEVAQDFDFFDSNQVTYVVNCAGSVVPNGWASISVKYLTYEWSDTDGQIILDGNDKVIGEVYDFMQGAVERAESVLVHSENAQSRSCTVIIAYLMMKYKWALQKAMDFLSSRSVEMRLNPAFLEQLAEFEQRLSVQSDAPLSFDWEETDIRVLGYEQLMLRNTYMNSQPGVADELNLRGEVAWKPGKLKWMDNPTGRALDNIVDNPILLEKPAGVDRHNVFYCGKEHMEKLVLTSVLKGSAGLASSISTTATADAASLTSGVSSPTSQQLSATPAAASSSGHILEGRKVGSNAKADGRWTSKQDGPKVHRFLLCFEPPALAVEWSELQKNNSTADDDDHHDEWAAGGRRAAGEEGGSLSSTAPELAGNGTKTLTRIEFSLDDLIDVRARAARLIAEHPFFVPTSLALCGVFVEATDFAQLTHLRGRLQGWSGFARGTGSGD